MEFLDNSCSLSLFLPCSFCYDKNSLFYLIGGTHYEFTGHHPRTDRHNSCTRDGGDGRRSETQRPASSAILAANFPAAAFRIRFLPFFRIFCATMKARIIRQSTFCCAATIRKRFVSSASTSATTVLPTVRRFCARSRKNFPLLFPGLSSSVSISRHPGHLRFLVFCIRGQNRSDIRHLLLSAPLHGSS